MGWILGIGLLILALVCVSDLHVFTSYTYDTEKAYKEFFKWKKNYEKTTNQEVVVIDVKRGGTYIDFYYKTRKAKKKK